MRQPVCLEYIKHVYECSLHISRSLPLSHSILRGEMFDYIVAHRRLGEAEACKFFHQIVDGVEALHGFDITHRDLKPEVRLHLYSVFLAFKTLALSHISSAFIVSQDISSSLMRRDLWHWNTYCMLIQPYFVLCYVMLFFLQTESPVESCA